MPLFSISLIKTAAELLLVRRTAEFSSLGLLLLRRLEGGIVVCSALELKFSTGDAGGPTLNFELLLTDTQ